MSTPKKPRPDFPLTPCGNGQWRKIVNGHPYYFGSWRDDLKGEEALKEWCNRKDGIYAGLDHVTTSSKPTGDGLTVGQLITQYLVLRSSDVKNHKLAPDTFRDYTAELNAFAAFTGKDAKAEGLSPKTFAAYRVKLDARKLGPHAMKRVLACVKVAFNYAMDDDWIKPIRFGRSFDAPPTDGEAVAQFKLRAGETDRTEIVLTRKQIRKLLRAVNGNAEWKAFILLLLNTAMNPAELARLKWSEVNFKSGRLARKRWKTGIKQENYLWKRTRKALAAVPNTHAYVFVREDGRLWTGNDPVLSEQDGEQIVTKLKRWNFITRDFLPIAIGAGLPDVTPYTLRRTARTLAANCTDDNAAKRMMGQALTGRDTTYIKRPFPMRRLLRIAMTIYRRMFKPKDVAAPAQQQQKPAA